MGCVLAERRVLRVSLLALIDWFGALAQLGERNTGSVEVSGSIPLGSTSQNRKSRFNNRTLANEVSFAGVFRVYSGFAREKEFEHYV